MAKPDDSIRLKKEALQCETAAKLADFLERYVTLPCYDFVLPDLLSFKCEETLLKLREIATWQTLESEFKAVGGWLSEDWDEIETDEIIPPHPVDTPTAQRTQKSRVTRLIVITFAVSAFIGGLIGWNYPYFRFPVLSRQINTTVK
jgi:hypothetical protein